MNGTLSQINWKECVWKYLNDSKDRGKIKVQKYLEISLKFGQHLVDGRIISVHTVV